MSQGKCEELVLLPTKVERKFNQEIAYENPAK